MNNKGVFFTALTIVIISIFALSSIFFSDIFLRERTQERVKSLNDFVLSVEEDLPRQIYVNGFRTIFILEKRTTETGNYQNNVQEVFQEAFFNGTIYGEVPEQNLLVGTTFTEIVEDLQGRAQRVNANVSITFPSLTVSQGDTWNVWFTLEANLLVEDVSGLAEWKKHIVVVAKVPIKNFVDPIYLVETNGYVNKFEQSPYSDFSNSANLLDHVDNSYYIASATAPNFLQRLEGDFSAGENGVESLVDSRDLSIAIKQRSAVDYIYFSNFGDSSCQVSSPSGLPSGFRLDAAHLSVYSASCS